jgi:hypothetical protein
MEVSIINAYMLYAECTQENHKKPMNSIRFRKQCSMEQDGDFGNVETSSRGCSSAASREECTSFYIHRGCTKTVQNATRQMYHQLEDGKQHALMKHVNTNLDRMWIHVSKDIAPSEIKKC